MWDQLLNWSAKEFGHLPWRHKRTLYRTLVSEIMLQQTTVATVLQHFERFLLRFPDLKTLAKASEEELLVAWKGLGYYRRAKNLKKIAEKIAQDWKGEFPEGLDDLQTIPGIGPYTANALVAIGMDRPALAIDANLERVLARIYGIKTAKGPRLQKQLSQLFIEKKIVKDRHHSFRALNEALMDLGRTICQANRVACEICSMKKNCQAFKQGSALSYPLGATTAPKKNIEYTLCLLRVVVKKGSKVLAYQKSEGEWLAGQWELPTFVISCDDKKLNQYLPLKTKLTNQDLPIVKTGITKYSIINHVLEVSPAEWKEWNFDRETSWREFAEGNGNLSTASTKCLAKI